MHLMGKTITSSMLTSHQLKHDFIRRGPSLSQKDCCKACVLETMEGGDMGGGGGLYGGVVHWKWCSDSVDDVAACLLSSSLSSDHDLYFMFKRVIPAKFSDWCLLIRPD